MITLRTSAQRGYADHGWLQSFHSFSFADYYDPAHMHFGSLRVINDDKIASGQGFGTHGHRDMEIITYILEGELAHKDNIGNGSVIVPGDVQRMSAGTGIMHSEFNHAPMQTHLLQIWIMPNQFGFAPSYEQTHFSAAEKRGRLRLVASPDGAQGSVTLHQEARLFAGLFDGAEQTQWPLDETRLCYVHVARGTLNVNGHTLQAGDAAQFENETLLELKHGQNAEVLVFDLARH